MSTLNRPGIQVTGLAFVVAGLACTLTPGQPAAPTVEVASTIPPPTAAAPDDSVPQARQVEYAGITFSYDVAVADSVEGTVVPEEQFMGSDVIPSHVQFTFTGYPLADTFHEPHVTVYPIADFVAGSPAAAANIDAQRVLLAEPQQQPGQEIPFLPLFNAAQIFHAQVAYLDFGSGAGVRFLTQYAQGFVPINSHELFYTYQGITTDSLFYVAAVLPVAHDSLPADGNDIPGGDFDAFSANFEGYVADVAAQLDAQDAASFTPDLGLLDDMMQSLAIE